MNITEEETMQQTQTKPKTYGKHLLRTPTATGTGGSDILAVMQEIARPTLPAGLRRRKP